ncbi:MAG: LamG domain-containing protein, partial [Caldilineaceae bacterium]|nr:LamG domain-containing protein [Caldilineaceae bacterium]
IIEAGSFHHVAGTYDGSTMTLYWDGTQVGSLEVEGNVARGDGVYLSLQDEPLDGALDEVAIYNRALSATEITELFGAKSILSPAAYLIYLLDFVSRSIEPVEDAADSNTPALNSLAGFRQLFKQDFSTLLATEANNDPVSYVECTNVILETLIAELDGYSTEQARPPIPQGPAHDAEGVTSPIPAGPAVESAETNPSATEQPTPVPTVVAASAETEALDTQPGTTRSRCGSPVNPALLDAIYAQFQSVQDPAVISSATSNNVLGPQLFVDLFDAYVQQLDTTRAQVRLVMSGTETLQNNLVGELHLPNRAALQQINLGDATITGTGYSSIVALPDLLWDVKWAEAEAATRGEQQADLRDTMYRQFRTDYRAFQQDEITRVLQELIQSIDANSATRDQELAQKQTDARTCVLQGGEACPPNSTYSQNPLRMLRELLKHESQYLAPKSDRSYMFSLEGSLGDLNQAQEELIVSEFFTQGISITAPMINVIDSNQWAVVADTDEYRIEKSDDLYNVSRYCGGAASTVEQVLCLRENELTTQRFQELLEEFPAERQKERLRKEALTYAAERLWTEDEFERQLEKLAKAKYEQEFAGPLPVEVQKEAQALAQQEWQASIDQAEAGYQTKLRANLLALLKRKLSDMYIRADESFEEALANKLLLDLFMDESQVTTPLAFAIGRLHTLVQGARLGSDRRYRPLENFDESAWSILSSYGIFHAAMTVSNYPESFLFPELRPNQSSLFETARISVTQGIDINQVHEEYAEQLDQLRELNLIAVVPAEDKIFIFADNRHTVTESFLGGDYTILHHKYFY